MPPLLPDFKDAHILVIGDIMLDQYWSGATQRISPEAPVPVVKIDDEDERLGGAANVALNLSKLGCSVALSGYIGDDSAGRRISELLEKQGISDKLQKRHQQATIRKLRIISQHQQLLRLDFEENQTLLEQLPDIDALESNIQSADIVVISDYAKGIAQHIPHIIALCKKASKTVLADPKGTNFDIYRNVNLLTPNRSELENIVGPQPSLSQLFSAAQSLCEQFNIDNILITLSEKGMALVRKNGEPFHIPTEAKEVFDVTGAGDTVIATIAASLASQTDIQSAMRLSNLAAGIAVGKMGTATVTPLELLSALKENHLTTTDVTTPLEEFKTLIQAAKAKGEKIVFTNGCFDILHAGHIRYLKQAAALGDRLVIGLNSDASIARLKGPERPIVTLTERSEVLSELGYVDWVIPFDEDTPADLITAVLPDFLVKGGDYIAEKIVGYNTVTKAGGKVVIMPYLDGCSTTGIIEKIRSQKIKK